VSPFWKGFCRGLMMPWTVVTDYTTVRWNSEEHSLEYYWNKSHVAVFGFFEDGALFNWSILWGGPPCKSGRWPKKKPPQADGETDAGR